MSIHMPHLWRRPATVTEESQILHCCFPEDPNPVSVATPDECLSVQFEKVGKIK
jgi:hypothetical protein